MILSQPSTNPPAMTPTILIADDHEIVLKGTVDVLQNKYPNGTIVTTRTASEALSEISLRYETAGKIASDSSPQESENDARESPLDLVVLDLALPNQIDDMARVETGLQLIATLMRTYPHLNILVQSAETRSLIRLMPSIYSHEGGFAVVEKSALVQEMLAKVEWALQGIIYTPKDMRQGIEVKEQWTELLRLAFVEALQDQAIAKRMKIAQRTVRNYWSQIQNVLEVYPDDEKNIRILTGLRAREAGLID
jgi:DNA-binding NarL/FixJ family response regulator